MTIAIDPSGSVPAAASRAVPQLGVLATAGFASLGAGALHAAAVGVHSEHRQAVWVFVVTAVFQLGWGVAALVRGKRLWAAIGIVGNGALIAGWILAKTNGISFIDGLDERESIQFADGLAAALAAVAVLLSIAAVVRRTAIASSGRSLLAGVAVGALALPGMAAAGSHRHAAGAAHDHGAATAAGDEATHAHGDDGSTGGAAHNHADDGGAPIAAATDDTVPHSHGDDSATTDPVHQHGSDDTTAHADHAPTALPTKPYDPTQPLDFGGVEGVTPEQQAAAENLVAITLSRLPKFSDPAVAESLGWKSIGDGLTGFEHYINWDIINDQDFLNPDMPESLVYEVDRATGEKKLASAMFMLRDDITLDQVPNIGGELMQWHIHDNLCFTTGDTPRVAGITRGDGSCPEGLQKFRPAPMIHVWIQPHRCGPFAALEGVGAGQILDGEERLCDHAHGAGF